LHKKALIIGIVFLILAAVVFVFADGARRYYSGGFFALLGIVLILNAGLRRQ